MTTKMAAIPMDNPFHMTVQMETSVGYQWHGVKAGSEVDKVLALTAGNTNGTVISGVLQNDVNEDEYVKMVYFGITKARANDDGISRDDLVECIYNADTGVTSNDLRRNGTFKKLTLASHLAEGLMVAGIALEDADQYEIFKIFLLRQIMIYES